MKKIIKRTGIVIVLFMALVGILLLSSFGYNKYAVDAWLKKPRPPGKLVNLGTHKLYATLKGEGSPTIILLPGMNAFSWGWWEIQDELAKTSKVLSYDRSGYSWSEASPAPYSSKQIVTDLHTLLRRLAIEPPYRVVGASMGGVYAKHFAKLYTDEVMGAVFVDPSALDEKQLRNPERQQAVLAGREKTSMNEIAATFGLFRYFGRYLLRMHRIPDYQMSFAVEALSNPAQHVQMQKHFASLYRLDDNHYLNAPDGFPDIPVMVIVQDNEATIRYALQYGEIPKGEPETQTRNYLQAVKERQQKDYMELSEHSEWIVAEGSGHNVQFDRPDLIIDSITKMLHSSRKSRP